VVVVDIDPDLENFVVPGPKTKKGKKTMSFTKIAQENKKDETVHQKSSKEVHSRTKGRPPLNDRSLNPKNNEKACPLTPRAGLREAPIDFSSESSSPFVRNSTKPAAVASGGKSNRAKRKAPPSGDENIVQRPVPEEEKALLNPNLPGDASRKRRFEAIPYDPKDESFIAMPLEKKIKVIKEHMEETKMDMINVPRELRASVEVFMKNEDRHAVLEKARLSRELKEAKAANVENCKLVARRQSEEQRFDMVVANRKAEIEKQQKKLAEDEKARDLVSAGRREAEAEGLVKRAVQSDLEKAYEKVIFTYFYLT
jgi:hypothetical protein